MIACVLVPYFAATVERWAEPALIGVPLIIGGFPWEAGKVFAVSREAAQAGVQPGARLRQAQAICPQARFLPAAQAHYREAFERLTTALAELAPAVEPGETHPAATIYLDLQTLAQEEPVEVVQAVARTAREKAGLASAIGLAVGKFPARLAAAMVEPDEALLIAPGYESTFLAPLPVGLLPLDKEMARRLQLLGIRTLGQLAGLPAGSVAVQLGMQGQFLHRLAAGHTERRDAVVSAPSEMVESTGRLFTDPVSDGTILETVLQRLAVVLAKRLRRRGLAVRQVLLRFQLEGGSGWESRVTLRRPTAHPDRLARVLVELLAQAALEDGVTGLEVTLSELSPAIGRQLDLFACGVEQDGRLHQALQDLTARYGADCFFRVSLTDPTAPLPERRFRIRTVEEP